MRAIWRVTTFLVIVLALPPSLTISSHAQSSDVERIEVNPAWSPDGGQIAFQAVSIEDYEAAQGKPITEYNYDIWVMEVDGSNSVNLTADNSTYDGLPVWSPDSCCVAFVSKRSGNMDVWVMRSDGSNPLNLTVQNLGDDLYPRWSPDGQLIAYIADNIRGVSTDIWIVEPDGENPRKLTVGKNHLYGGITWSPDSKSIAYADAIVNPEAEDISESFQNFQPNGVSIIPIDGTSAWAVTSQRRDLDVAWSPQGNLLATTVYRDLDSEIWIVGVDGVQMVNLAGVTPGIDAYPTWSPDGSRILFMSERVGVPNAWDIWIMNADGSAPNNLTIDFGAVNSSPRWSPTGNQIGFSSLPKDNDSELGFSLNADIWIMASDGSNKTNLTKQ